MFQLMLKVASALFYKLKKLYSTLCWGQISTFWGVTKNGSEWSIGCSKK